ncbi:hypothetical protein [Breznakiella homolactica]|uniref:Leucine-rich repeat domain-containing protein n=1 Tax=Breznakiella homolactica TaxID=2798577 RepID=A0A7T7XJT3_9SPIR|nr:hypothetical protein [Breznakiella homolactica]QQO07719.1 hypothetical protein JFL75_12270 [Breznakiella homolactica]
MEKSVYNKKEDALVLAAFGERDMRLLERHCDAGRINLWFEGTACPDLDFLLPCEKLEKLAIFGGNISDYSALGRLPNLKELFMNGRLRRWLDCFDFLGCIRSAEKIQIMNYPMVSSFPNLANCINLETVEISGCKRLTDISNVVTIPRLKSFGISGTQHSAAELEFIARKAGMLAMQVSLKNRKETDAFETIRQRYNLAVWI